MDTGSGEMHAACCGRFAHATLKTDPGEVDAAGVETSSNESAPAGEHTAMNGDTGFFATPRPPVAPTTAPPGPTVAASGISSSSQPHGQAPPPPHGQVPLPPPASMALGPPLTAQRSDARSPVLGVVACVLVAFGVGWTALAGNLGGLIGMPIMLTGTVLGAVSWGRHGSSWGMAAVVGTGAVIGLAVLSEFVRMMR